MPFKVVFFSTDKYIKLHASDNWLGLFDANKKLMQKHREEQMDKEVEAE